MLLAWVQATRTVFSESRGFRVDISNLGFEVEVGVHHFMVREEREARVIQEAMLASCKRRLGISVIILGERKEMKRYPGDLKHLSLMSKISLEFYLPKLLRKAK